MLKNKWVNFVRLFVSTWLNLVYIFFFKRSGPKFSVAISLPNVNEFWVLGIICVTWVAWRNGNPARSCFRLCKLFQFIWGNHWRDETCTNKGVRGGLNGSGQHWPGLDIRLLLRPSPSLLWASPAEVLHMPDVQHFPSSFEVLSVASGLCRSRVGHSHH